MITDEDVLLAEIKLKIEDETQTSGITHQELAEILGNMIRANPVRGGNSGIYVRDREVLNYGNIGNGAVDFSYSDQATGLNGATGDNAFASGINIKASGFGSAAMGFLIDSSATCDFNAGINLFNRGYSSSLFGTGHDIKGMNILVGGQASLTRDLQIADYNDSPELKPLFVIGNGTIQNNDQEYTVLTRSDAFIVSMDGSVVAPSLTPELITADTTGKILISKEYFENNAPGLQQVLDVDNVSINTQIRLLSSTVSTYPIETILQPSQVEFNGNSNWYGVDQVSSNLINNVSINFSRGGYYNNFSLSPRSDNNNTFLAPNKTSGVYTLATLEDIPSLQVPYDSYFALLSQTGTSAPTAEILINELGVTIAWEYLATGNYKGVASSARFTTGKSAATGSATYPGGLVVLLANTTTVVVNSYSTTYASMNSQLYKTPVEIRVYRN